MSECSADICDGTGWREAGDGDVIRCECSGGPASCPVGECIDVVGVDLPVCDHHWQGVPARLATLYRKSRRAWLVNRSTLREHQAIVERVVDAAAQGVLL